MGAQVTAMRLFFAETGEITRFTASDIAVLVWEWLCLRGDRVFGNQYAIIGFYYS